MCANGNNKVEFAQNAKKARCGIRKTTLFPTEKLCTDYYGQLNKDYIYEVDSLDDKSRMENIYEDLMYQLLEDADLSLEDIKGREERIGFSFATSVGANDYITAHVKGTIKHAIAKSNIYKLISNYGIAGPAFINTSACAAGTTAIGIAYSLVTSGVVDMVIAGGADPLTEFSSYGFHSLKNMSDEPCKPFDQKRKGINLGEGGALFVIESYESAKQRNAKIYAEVMGYGLGNDAYHATSPDPTGEGAYRVMIQALTQAEILPAEVDYINAHGTGTLINDSMESKAIEKLACRGSVTSTKSQTGHCLAAAGAIEFAATILCMQEGIIYPNVNLDEPIEAQNINFVKGESQQQKVKHAISNSFAFAGNSASIVLGGV